MKNQSKKVKNRLASSLTAENSEILPFLPFLLQDFWELGSEPHIIIDLIKKHTNLNENARILDLGCGKGAVSIQIAEKLQITVRGIDLMPSFIAFAQEKAKQLNVSNLCNFSISDINNFGNKQHDCVILGAVGAICGTYPKTFRKLTTLTKKGGYIIIDDAYIETESTKTAYNSYVPYLTQQQWNNLLQKFNLKIIAIDYNENPQNNKNLDSTAGIAALSKRANQLSKAYPDKSELFENYLISQKNEYDDIDNNIICATWLLQKQ
ncbi:MAG: class I SAM-dependent methyltransferase [Firmicutes bacterium]|nr:class I SAM-dependent methyltransferase [Bacillota bacterium]